MSHLKKYWLFHSGLLLVTLSIAGGYFVIPDKSGAQTLPVRVVRFDGVSGLPTGAVFNSTFEGIGFDNTGKVFTTLCDAEENVPGRGNCFVFSWDPVSGAKRYYDNFLDSARRANNLGPTPAPNADWWPARETIVKGHTHLQYMAGQMWMGSMGVHGYDDMTGHRGVHLFALNLSTGQLVDHSQWQPKGVFHERGGTYTVEVVPDQNLVLSIGVPNCTIIKYNPTTRATTRTPGVPVENNPQLSGRDMVLLPGNKLLYQCGSGATSFGLYNVDDNTNEVLDFRVDDPISLSYAKTADGQKVYISTSRNIYRFDLATKTGTLIAPLMADGANRQTGPVNLSPDEKKLYYVVNMTGPEPSPYLMDLYEYNLETNTRTKLVSLQPTLGEGAKLSGSHSMRSNWKLYQVFNGRTAGIVEIDLSSRAGSSTGAVAAPTISPNGSSFTATQSVTLSTVTAGATIRYTLDGSTPTTASTLYSSAFTLTSSATVKAKAWKAGMTESAVSQATFTKSVAGPSDCLLFPSGSTPPSGVDSSGRPWSYGASWDVFSSARELLVKSNCPSSGNALTISVGKGDVNHYIYENIYYFNNTVSPPQWVLATLSGRHATTSWLSGAGTINITTPFTARTSNPLYFVGYVCVSQSTGWKCGCSNASCTLHNWHLQGYTGLGGSDGTTSCPLKNNLFLNPFKADSAHHRPIGTGAVYSSPTDPKTLDLRKASTITLNIGAPFGVSTFVTDNTGPLKTVTAKPGCDAGIGIPATIHFPFGTIDVPINLGNRCGDGMIAIYNTSDSLGHQIRSYTWNGGSPYALQYVSWPMRGLGHGVSSGDRIGTGASAVAAIFGLLRGEEINTPGRPIQHALQIVLPRTPGGACGIMLSRGVQLPAVSADGNIQPDYNTGNIDYGDLIALPPESKGGPNLDSLGLSEAGKRLAQAFRDYGVYVTDGTGSNCPALRTDQFVANKEALKTEIGKFYPYLRVVLNGAWTPNQSAVGGGTPIALNCAFDAP